MNSLMEFRQRVNRNALAASAQRSNEMLELQAMRDNAPVGAVGAPGGLPNMSGPASTGRDPLSGLLGLGAMLPGPTGDILGPIAEANMFYNEPASRTIGNYALAGIGALPAIPSLMYLMNRGGGQANRLAQARPGQAGVIGYHSSPHKFDEFDMSKVGTGEGNQAYGYGLYSAESPAVSGRGGVYDQRFTAQALGKYDLSQAEAATLRAMAGGASDTEVLGKLAKDGIFSDFDEAQAMLDKMKGSRSHIYEMDIPDEDVAKMLDWDAPLGEQTESVRKALGIPTLNELDIAEKPLREEMAELVKTGKQGSDRGGQVQTSLWQIELDRYHFYEKYNDAGEYYQALASGSKAPNSMRYGSQEEVSNYLSERGIPGNKYFDGDSRTARDGTRNFVMFDDKLAKILKRE